MLERFEEITGFTGNYFYMSLAFVVGLLLAWFMWSTLVAGWQRQQKGEMSESDLFSLLMRLFILFFFFLFFLKP